MYIVTIIETSNNEINKEVACIRKEKHSKFSNSELTALIDIQALV